MDPALTRLVWRRHGRRPFILAFNPSTHWRLGTPRDRFGERKICPFPAEQLIGHLCYNLADKAALQEVRRDLARVRRHFGLSGSARLIAAVAGNHSSMCAALNLGVHMGSASLATFMMKEGLRDRKLSCLIEATLGRMGGVDLRWLADLAGNVGPQSRTSSYEAVVAEVRASLDETQRPLLAGKPETRLKLPATPRIYVRRGASAPWLFLPTINPRPGWESDTAYASEECRRDRTGHLADGGPEPEGLLVKILATDLRRHTPADTPMITVSQRDAARRAGIKAILLDGRAGVVCRRGRRDDEMAGATRSLPVYGA